jgi:hypothetical protein
VRGADDAGSFFIEREQAVQICEEGKSILHDLALFKVAVASIRELVPESFFSDHADIDRFLLSVYDNVPDRQYPVERYQAGIPSADGLVPFLDILWDALFATESFSEIKARIFAFVLFLDKILGPTDGRDSKVRERVSRFKGLEDLLEFG